tara:strand:+ start:31 stop:264 length:234 start_codon:yes stop_codon:yes gene_type:complete
MNVTLQLEEELGEAARHRADDAGTSLSVWITNLLKRELVQPGPQTKSETLLELLGSDDEGNVDFARAADSPREIDLS